MALAAVDAHIWQQHQLATGARATVRFEATGAVYRAYVNGVVVDIVVDADPILAPGRIGARYHDVPESPGFDMARYLSLRWSGS